LTTIITELPANETKPDPAVLFDIAKAERTTPFSIAYIGDSLSKDILMAKKAGCFAIWARYGVHRDPAMYERLVRISHWTHEDILRERNFAQEASMIAPDKITFLPVSCAFAMPTGKTLNARLLNSPAVIRELDKFIFVSPVFRLLIRPHRLRAQHRGARFIAKVRLRAGLEHLNKLASLHARPQAQETASYRLKRIPDRG
jgi:hypothetical protein